MILNDLCKIAKYEWLETAKLRNNVELDEYIIMPNHMHGIIILTEKNNIESHTKKNDVETRRGVLNASLEYQETEGKLSTNITHQDMFQQREFSKPIKNSLSTIINLYKGSVTKECNIQEHNFKWQPKFYDRIIRNDKELFNIRRYIKQNPMKWELEKGSPDNLEF